MVRRARNTEKMVGDPEKEKTVKNMMPAGWRESGIMKENQKTPKNPLITIQISITIRIQRRILIRIL